MNNNNIQKIIMQKRQKVKALKRQIDNINDDIYKLQSDMFNQLQAKFDFRKQENNKKQIEK